MAAGDTLRRIGPQDQWILDGNGNLIGVKNPNASGFDFRVDSYDRNSLTLLGDSRLAQAYGDTAKQRRAGYNFIGRGLALSGQRMRIAANLATSGLRSDQYLLGATVASALATNSHWLMVYGVVNDINQFSNATDYWTAYIKPVAQAWIAQGRGVILCTETGSNGFTGDAGRIGAVMKYNRQIRDFCKTTPGAVLFDIAALVMDPASAMNINASYSGDGTHINLVSGAALVGQAFATLITSLASPCDGLPYSVGQVYANGGVQWFPNPLFTTTTGGSGGGFMTGSVPLGITNVLAPSGTAITNTIVASNYGNDLQMAITTTQSGAVTLQMDLGSVATESPGDVFYANANLSVASGSSNFQCAGMYLDSTRASVSNLAEDGVCANFNGALPNTAAAWVSETERLTIQPGTRNWFVPSLNIYFAGSGSATIKLGRVGVWKVVA